MDRINTNRYLGFGGREVLRGLLLAIGLATGGCNIIGGDDVSRSTTSEMDAFNRAGLAVFHVDQQRIYQSRNPIGPYRVVAGDLLELQMPVMIQSVGSDLAEPGRIDRMETYRCRVQETGRIRLPIIGECPAAGLTLQEIEEAIQQAYYPKYVVMPPAVVTQVQEYRKPQITVIGAVVKPGRYGLRSDQLTLVSALMEAGGIVETGAAVIRIHHAGQDVFSARSRPEEPLQKIQVDSETELNPAPEENALVLPVKGLNIPFADVLLQDGDTIEIEGIQNHVFTVVGLVNKQGTFPYPTGMSFNLAEAIAFAGGLNETAEPRFARIYRPTRDGHVLDVLVGIEPGRSFAESMRIVLRPGDVVAVEQTPRTRRNLVLAELFSLKTSFGVYYNP